jgi:hypothetical protein
MFDAYISTVMLSCGIEIKEFNDDYDEITMQLKMWSAIGLEKMRFMLDVKTFGVVMPLLRIIVIKHE